MTGPENLAEVFGPAAKSLAGRLPPRRTSAAGLAQPSVVQEQPAPAAQPAPPARVAPVDASPAERIVQPEVRPSPVDEVDEHDEDDQLPAQISVYVLPAVVTAVRRVRRGRTNAQIAFEAITAVRDQLPTLVARHRTSASRPTGGVGPFAPQPSDKSSTGPRRVLWTFKATGRNQRILDQIVREVGAESRSQLVAAALEAHLLRRRVRR